MPHTDSTKRPDVEMVTATVVDGVLAAGDGADVPVPWWSFTKTVLAAAALVLVDAGRLTLDTPLDRRRYTLRQLLQHRAGVPDYGALAAYHEAVASGQSPWPVASCSHASTRTRPVSSPVPAGCIRMWAICFVRQIIEETAGEEIGEALSRLVLTPLGIANARLARTPDDLLATRWGNARRLSSGMGLSRAHDRIARGRGAAARSIAARRPVVRGRVARHARQLSARRAHPGPAVAGAGLWSRIDDRNHHAAALHGTHRAGAFEHRGRLPFSGARRRDRRRPLSRRATIRGRSSSGWSTSRAASGPTRRECAISGVRD